MVASRNRIRRTPAAIRWIVLAGIALVLVWASWISVRGLIAREQLASAVPLAQELRDSVLAGASTEAEQLVLQLEERVQVAHDMTHDVVWQVTERVPWIGPNLEAVRQVTEVVRTITSEGVDPLLSAASKFNQDSLAIEQGVIDLQPIIAVQADIAVANDIMGAVAAKAADIDREAVVRPVRDAIEQLLGLVNEARATIDAIDRISHLLPAMLGADGERSTLVLIQNNAELRASGGVSGALAVISAEAGQVQLAAQASTRDFLPPWEESILPLDAPTAALYGQIAGRYIQDVNLTPWFDTTAILAKTMWEDRIGGSIDAVVAVDPVLLSYLLQATGPVEVGEVVLTSDNAVDVLLNGVYFAYANPADQDVFFAEAARAVFEAVTSSAVDSKTLVEALVRGGEEHRVRIWSSRAEEQRYVEGTSLAGVLPSEGYGGDVLGLFFNDGTGAKMNYYTDISATVARGVCGADGLPDYRVTVTVKNSAPADAATSLPTYVTADGAYGVAPGDIEMFVTSYGPLGAEANYVTRDGVPVPVVIANDRGRPAVQANFVLGPGESTTFEVEYLGTTPARGPLRLWLTPTINVIETQHRALGC